MKTITYKWMVLILLVPVFGFTIVAHGQQTKTVKNIVLVHGAFVDGSGWLGIYNILTKHGYKVSVTQHSTSSYDTDVAAVNRIIDQQDGPCILVGHSYGGAVITTAGNNPKVAGLVFIAAHAPDAGESEADNGKLYPSAYKSLIKGDDGLDYINPRKFPADFANGVPSKTAEFMAYSQPTIADNAFHAIIQNPAWKIKPVWCVIAKSDRIINPELERFYAKRANSVKTMEVEGAGHCVYMTHPKECAALIISASKGK